MSQKKMMRALTRFFDAQNDLRVFAMNGSKTNKNIEDDIFKDYDVVFFTDKVEYYKNNPDFLNQFGDILLYTEPEVGAAQPFFPKGNGYIYLVQYADGERIDIQFRTLDQLPAYLSEDSLTMVVGDKDGRIKETIIPNDSDYWLPPPSDELYLTTINEFWWEYLNTLKATIRGELLLAQFYLNLTRDELVHLITWEVAFEQGFDRNYGKKQTKILNDLSPERCDQLMKTFETQTKEKIFEALQIMSTLMGESTRMLEKRFEVVTPALNQAPVIYLRSKNQQRLADQLAQRIADGASDFV